MAGIKLEGSTSGNVAEVDANLNLKVNGPITESQAGFVALSSELDAGSYTGTRKQKALEVSENFRLRVGQDQLCFADQFSVAQSYNVNNWTSIVSTMTQTNAAGLVNLNAGSSVASGAYASFKTWRQFPVIKQFTTKLEMNVQFTQAPQTNSVCEWGMFAALTTNAPSDGAFFRLASDGTFIAVVCNNNSEIPSAALNFSTLVGTNTTKSFLIDIDANAVNFWINNILVATINISAALSQTLSSMSAPIHYRNYNAGAVSGTAQIMKVGAMSLTFGEQGASKPWADVMAGMNGSALQIPTGAGGQSALYTNSLAAGAGSVLTNTTAAAGTGLGGQFSVLPTLAAGTDGILCAYQVPSASTTIAGKTLYITGVRIQGAVTTVLAGNATPVVYAYALGVGSTQLSLATTDSATNKAPRRMPLGYESYAAAAAVGTLGQGVSMQFTSPICAYQGEYVHIIAKNLGVVTSTGVISILVTIDGYWE